MRKLALTLSALGLLAFTGVARADQKTENSDKTDSTTTLGGKHKTTRIKKVVRSDGSSFENKVETTTPKDADKRDINEGKDEMNEKTEHRSTLTGKEETTTTKKVEKPDGTQIESTTTTTEPKDENKK
jgi:hypothetical protein